MKAKDITIIAMMIAIITVLGLIPAIPLGIIPVPIVFQNLGIMLAGITLGSKKGGLTIFLFLCLVGLGLPLLSGGRGGFSVFLNATSGYMLAWIVAAIFIGLGKHKFSQTNNVGIKFLIIWLPGVLLVDIVGSIGLSIITGMNIKDALLSNLIFIPGDTFKAILVVIIADRLLKISLFR